VKNGVLTLSSGPGASLKVAQNHLIAQDGGTELKFRRAACPVSRVVVVRSEGFITIPALRWLHEVGSALVVLQYDGTPIAVTVPRVIGPAALRRAQAATTIETRLGKAIAGCLIRAKLAGQIATLRSFDRGAAAVEISAIAERMRPQASASDLLGVEGMASAVSWQALADVSLQFGKRQEVPDHWRVFGARRSSMTGDPRGAVLPAQAMLNYLYGVLASEITIALHAVGLDPMLGILHADKDGRASLAYDLMEPARPILDRWLLHWLGSATFSKRDFREDIYGFIRVTHPLNSHLAMTAALWRGIAEQLAQWIYQRLSGANVHLRLTGVDLLAGDATSRAARWRVGNALQRPIPRTCAECGKALPTRRRKFCSDDCVRAWHGGHPNAAGLTAIARAWAARRASGERVRHAPSRIEAVSVAAWRRLPGWSQERDTELVAWYVSTVAPRLRSIRPSEIRRALSCGDTYAIGLRGGSRIPHPRLIRQLAGVANVEYPF
jgi:CRISPR-associated endonuclease Cas1